MCALILHCDIPRRCLMRVMATVNARARAIGRVSDECAVRGLGKKLGDDSTVDVGEPKIASGISIRELFVIEP